MVADTKLDREPELSDLRSQQQVEHSAERNRGHVHFVLTPEARFFRHERPRFVAFFERRRHIGTNRKQIGV